MSMKEQRRAKFEDWWNSPANRGQDPYIKGDLRDAWNAALDSVVIELPDCFETYGYSAEVARVATDCCADAIEAAGLKVKP